MTIEARRTAPRSADSLGVTASAFRGDPSLHGLGPHPVRGLMGLLSRIVDGLHAGRFCAVHERRSVNGSLRDALSRYVAVRGDNAPGAAAVRVRCAYLTAGVTDEAALAMLTALDHLQQ